MSLIDIEFDLSDVRRRCADGNAVLRHGARDAAIAAAREGLKHAKARRRYKDRTGALTSKAYAARVLGGASEGSAVIVWPLPYAAIVDGGTRPHDIYPKKGAGFKGPVRPGQGRKGRGSSSGLLVFQIGGRTIFARHVRHPGTTAYAFAGDAYIKAEAVLLREAEEAVRRVEAIFNG